jgi:alkyl hydroperoxide reductase subunit F
MLALLEDIAAQSPKITLSRDGTDARKPSFAIKRAGTDVSVSFAGLPMGHEFTSLILA